MLTYTRFATALLALGLTLGMSGWVQAQTANPAPPAAAPTPPAPAKIDLSFPDGEKWSAATERE